jgi:hypothetical protein
MKNNKEEDFITVYWAPAMSFEVEQHREFNMLYPEPENMFSYLKSRRSEFDQSRSMLVCPAFKDKMKRTFFFKNSVECNFLYETNSLGEVYLQDQKAFPEQVVAIREPAFDFGPTILVNFPYIFFSDSEVEASFSQPTFHPQGYSKYASIIPGSFNIGSWFRQYSTEFQMWNNSGEFIIKENEPMFYVEFLTDKKIKLVRFKYTKKLFTYAQHCVDAPQIFGKHLPLTTRYKKFKESRMRDVVLKEIRENIIGEFNG